MVGTLILLGLPAAFSYGCLPLSPFSRFSVRYFSYNLVIESALALPELLPSGTQAEAADVVVQFGKVQFKPPQFEGFDCAARGTETDGYLYWNDVGTFRIQDGRLITIDAKADVSEETLRLCLLGFVFAMLLHQRGLFVLHASGVEAGGGAVLFVGSSGFGKSTLAAALRTRGHTLITDDQGVLCVSGQVPLALPSFPRVKLWPDSLASLGADPEDLPRLVAETDKRSVSTALEFQSDPLPLHRLYFLDNADTPEITPMKLQAAMLGLIANSGLSFFRHLVSPAAGMLHFEQCRVLLSSIPAYTLKRSRSLDRLAETVDLVEDHLCRPF